MKRHVTLIALACLVSPTPVFAKAQQTAEETCVSFAGDWVGTCVETNEGRTETIENQTMSIAQDGCLKMNIDQGSAVYVIGGVTEHTVSTAEEWNSMLISVKWTEARKVLKGNINYTSRSLGNGPVISTNSNASILMKFDEQGQLIANSDGATVVIAPWNNEPHTSLYSSKCLYQKK
jgi:hypothetical protein